MSMIRVVTMAPKKVANDILKLEFQELCDQQILETYIMKLLT